MFANLSVCGDVTSEQNYITYSGDVQRWKLVSNVRHILGIKTLTPTHGRHFPGDIFKRIFLKIFLF